MSDVFTSPIGDRFFEDYPQGAVFEYGSVPVREDEIIEFARRYDPQIFHTDPEAAKDGPFGGLISSGWLTCGLMMKLYIGHYLSHNASLGSPGIDQLRWLKPVRPDDALSIRVSVEKTRRSKSRPDRGMVHSFIEVLNQHAEVVMNMHVVNMLLVRSEEEQTGKQL